MAMAWPVSRSPWPGVAPPLDWWPPRWPSPSSARSPPPPTCRGAGPPPSCRARRCSLSWPRSPSPAAWPPLPPRAYSWHWSRRKLARLTRAQTRSAPARLPAPARLRPWPPARASAWPAASLTAPAARPNLLVPPVPEPLHDLAPALPLSLPGLGHAILRVPVMALVATALGLLTWLLLRLTPLGLRLRALAEQPEAAERAGVATGALRAGALIAAAALAGFGGAALPLDSAVPGLALAGIVQGRGFAALAIALLAGRSLLAAGLLCLPLGLAWPLPAGHSSAILWVALLLALTLRTRRAQRPRALNWRDGSSA